MSMAFSEMLLEKDSLRNSVLNILEEAKNGDLVSYHIAADLLEENGENKIANGLRAMCKKQKAPRKHHDVWYWFDGTGSGKWKGHWLNSEDFSLLIASGHGTRGKFDCYDYQNFSDAVLDLAMIYQA